MRARVAPELSDSAGVSRWRRALGHLLNGRATIPVERGIFLSETRCLQPEVCAFTSKLFYEGRLVARPVDVSAAELGCALHPWATLATQNEAPEEVDKLAVAVEG